MNDSLFDLNLLRVFSALFTERSVTSAAKKLRVGQPAVSASLKRLRTIFGDPLFVRADGEMRPTPKAEYLAKKLMPILSSVTQTLGEESHFEPIQSRKVLRIASTDYTTLVLLPELMRRLRWTAPNMDVRVIAYEKDAIGGMLDRGEIDIALGVFSKPPDNSVKIDLFTESFVGLACQSHPALSDGKMSLDDFVSAPHVLVSVRQDERGVIDKILNEDGFERRIALVIPYMLQVPEMLVGSAMIAAIPSRLASRIQGEALAQFQLPIETDIWTVNMLWNPASRNDRPSEWLRRLIIKCAEAL